MVAIEARRVEVRWLIIFERVEVERYIEGYKKAVNLKDFCLRMLACVCACVREREKKRGERGMPRCERSVQE